MGVGGAGGKGGRWQGLINIEKSGGFVRGPRVQTFDGGSFQGVRMRVTASDRRQKVLLEHY